MMKVKGIFAVSLIAIMVVGGAYANVASSGYVNEKIDGLATVAKTGAYSDLSGRPTIPTVNNAKLTIQKNGATVDTFTANASANKTVNITVPTQTSQLTNNSGFITSADLPEDYVLPAATANALGGVKSGGDITVATSGAVTVNSATKADSATTAASATKATQDASGNVITSTYATKTELNAKQNASTAVEVATAGTAVGDSTHPVYVNASGVATKIDKVAAAAKADTATSATRATTATNATNDADGNEITETYATKSELTSGLSGKQATLSSAQLNAVNSGITSTKVSTYDGYNAKITAAQDAADDAAAAAAAAQSTASGKLSSISGSTGGTGNVVTSVSASGSTVSATKGITAEETKNKVTSVRAAASATDTAYPSEKAVATALAAKANTSALSGYATTSALGAVEDKAEAAQSAASAAQSTANAKVTTAQGSGNANKAVITNASGNITTGKIASGMIADGTITNADISDDAAIDAAKIDGLATVATSGSYNDLANKPSIPTVNNATLTIQKNGTNVATFTANSASAATANITVPTKTSELTNDSNFATTTQVNARVATAQGTDNANDVMVVNASGNVAPALITNANISSSAAIAQSKISGLTDALAGKLSTDGTAARATADASGNNIVNTYATKSQITALDSTSTGTGAVVTGVSQKDGKVSVTKGNVKIPVGGESATSYATIWIE